MVGGRVVVLHFGGVGVPVKKPDEVLRHAVEHAGIVGEFVDPVLEIVGAAAVAVGDGRKVVGHLAEGVAEGADGLLVVGVQLGELEQQRVEVGLSVEFDRETFEVLEHVLGVVLVGVKLGTGFVEFVGVGVIAEVEPGTGDRAAVVLVVGANVEPRRVSGCGGHGLISVWGCVAVTGDDRRRSVVDCLQPSNDLTVGSCDRRSDRHRQTQSSHRPSGREPMRAGVDRVRGGVAVVGVVNSLLTHNLHRCGTDVPYPEFEKGCNSCRESCGFS